MKNIYWKGHQLGRSCWSPAGSLREQSGNSEDERRQTPGPFRKLAECHRWSHLVRDLARLLTAQQCLGDAAQLPVSTVCFPLFLRLWLRMAVPTQLPRTAAGLIHGGKFSAAHQHAPFSSTSRLSHGTRCVGVGCSLE
uniref:Uncharacterized protein n=1 Tax=Molossus molossus TaxID=27622 RepID=A0A7J8J085_MOLMO|nr:hypothetical protein HJG59_010424 [Molossus molossus]